MFSSLYTKYIESDKLANSLYTKLIGKSIQINKQVNKKIDRTSIIEGLFQLFQVNHFRCSRR